MKFYKWANIIMALLFVVYLGFTVAGSAQPERNIFSSIWVVVLLSAFAALQILCLFLTRPRFSLYRAGFYLLHIGLVLFLAGSFFYYLNGDKIAVAVPVDPSATYSRIQRDVPDSSGEVYTDLNFGMGVSQFRVEKYDKTKDGVESDKFYEATLNLTDRVSLRTRQVSLTVNHPYRYEGWKIYLMGYQDMGDTGYRTVSLLFKKDPGEYIALAGIWMIIAGSVVMCLLKKRKAGDRE